MADEGKPKREQWGSRLGFLLAAIGSAVGLGNVWRFPYITGKYGGAAFLVVYLAAVAILGVPLMIVEIAIGRKTQRNATGAFRMLRPGSPWFILGFSSVVIGVLVLSFYSSIAGWTLAYVWKSLTSQFMGMSPEQIGAAFGAFVGNSPQLIFLQAMVMIATAWVVGRGIAGGIEKTCKYMMPALLVIEVILVVRAMTLPGAAAGLSFYLKPDFSKLTAAGVLAAIGQCFFSLNVGAGQCVIYGSYLARGETLLGNSMVIGLGDTTVAFLAGLIVFPAVFAFGLSPAEGPVLTFITLPNVFTKMPAGGLWGAAFYLLLFFAAFTSTIALLEITVGYLVDELRWTRQRAAWIAGLFIFLLGIPSSLAFGPWEGYKWFFGKNWFEAIDFLVSSLMLPIGAMLYAVFAAYVWKMPALLEEVNDGFGPKVGKWFEVCVKYLDPIIIAVVLLMGLGIIKA